MHEQRTPRSREQTVEELNRGDPVEIDLDEFAALDNGKCGCAICLTLRQALAEGHRGTISLGVPSAATASVGGGLAGPNA